MFTVASATATAARETSVLSGHSDGVMVHTSDSEVEVCTITGGNAAETMLEASISGVRVRHRSAHAMRLARPVPTERLLTSASDCARGAARSTQPSAAFRNSFPGSACRTRLRWRGARAVREAARGSHSRYADTTASAVRRVSYGNRRSVCTGAVQPRRS